MKRKYKKNKKRIKSEIFLVEESLEDPEDQQRQFRKIQDVDLLTPEQREVDRIEEISVK